jgi:AcrR family transcriptional regulator
VRGQRAQQRILEAALRVFGDEGYHQCGVSRITEVAGCSRAAFYQYFSSKEDVFRHLAGQVARQLLASAEALGPVGAGPDGWEALRAWVERHRAIHDRYEPVFATFQAAAESDEAVATGAARIAQRNVAGVRAKVRDSIVPARHLDPVIALVLDAMTRTRHIVGVLRAAAGGRGYPADRVDDALTDVIHRTLFGVDPAVNVHPPSRRRPPRLDFGPAVQRDLDGGLDRSGEITSAGARTLATLLAAGRDVLVARGYHGTRVDDIAEAAGVSHGAFYRYFDNKDDLVRRLALNAMGKVSTAFAAIPDVGTDGAGGAELRQWLRGYQRAYAAETAMIRVWLDATADDPALRDESAAALDWGRRRLAWTLRHRSFGDPDVEAVVLLAVVESFGVVGGVEAAAQIVERGLLGIP